MGNREKSNNFRLLCKTESPQDSLNTQSYKLAGNYEWNGLRATLAYTEVGEGFNPEVGYLFRSGFRKPEALIFQQVRMNGKYGLLEIRPHVSYRGYWNYSDFLETSFLHVDNHWVWISGLEIHTGINFTTEGVVNPFQISGITVDPGTYDHKEAQIVVMTNASKMFYVNTRSILGGSFGGTRYVNTGTLGFRLGDKFSSEYSVAVNDLRLPNGNALSTLLAMRLSYSFSPRHNFQVFAQHNSDAKLWSFNVRFSLLEQANTGLFVVYNDIYTNGLPNNRSFTIKYTRMFDLLNRRSKG